MRQMKHLIGLSLTVMLTDLIVLAAPVNNIGLARDVAKYENNVGLTTYLPMYHPPSPGCPDGSGRHQQARLIEGLTWSSGRVGL